MTHTLYCAVCGSHQVQCDFNNVTVETEQGSQINVDFGLNSEVSCSSLVRWHHRLTPPLFVWSQLAKEII